MHKKRAASSIGFCLSSSFFLTASRSRTLVLNIKTLRRALRPEKKNCKNETFFNLNFIDQFFFFSLQLLLLFQHSESSPTATQNIPPLSSYQRTVLNHRISVIMVIVIIFFYVCMSLFLHYNQTHGAGAAQKNLFCINSRQNFSHFSALERRGFEVFCVGGIGFSFFFSIHPL